MKVKVGVVRRMRRDANLACVYGRVKDRQCIVAHTQSNITAIQRVERLVNDRAPNERIEVAVGRPAAAIPGAPGSA